MNNFCKFIKKHSCKIIGVLLVFIIIVSLSDNQFERFELGNDSSPAIVFFYANWCGHCNKMKDEWNKFENEYNGKNGIKVIKIENEEDKSLMKLHGVNGFPTIKYCPKGVYNTDGTVDFDSPRTYVSLVNFHKRFSTQEGFQSNDFDDESDNQSIENNILGSSQSADELFTL